MVLDRLPSDRFKSSPLFIGLLVLVFLLPFSMIANRPSSWMPLLVGIYLLSLFWLIQYLRQKVKATPALELAWPVLVCIALVAIWMFVQATGPDPILSFDPHSTYFQLLKTLSYLCLFCLCLVLVENRKQLELLALVIVAAGVIQVMVKVGWGTHGTYVNRNHFAGYLEMSAALAIGLMLARLNKGDAASWRSVLRRWIHTLLGLKVVIRISLVIIVIGLILSSSRMGNTAFFGAMFLAGLVGLYAFRSTNKSVVIFFTSILLIDALLMGAFFGIDKLQQRFEQLNVAEDGRLFLTQQATQILEANWLTGIGAGAFYTVYPQYRDHRMPKYNDHVHNDYLEISLDLGIVAASLLAFCVLYSLYFAVRVQIQRRSQLMKAMGFGATMGMIAILIHSTADFNLQMTANAATFVVLMALPFLAWTIDKKGRAM